MYEPEQEKSDPREYWLSSLKSPETRRVYDINLRKYEDSIGENDIFFQMDAKLIERQVIQFVRSLKEQGYSYSNIKNYLNPVLSFYDIHDVTLTTKKIYKFLPEQRRINKDRPYRIDEISRLLGLADLRMKAVILLMTTSGVRIGAIPELRIRNLEKFKDVYKITAYENTNDEYITFCTPECVKAIDSYRDYRTRYGEQLQQDTFLIREQFNTRDKLIIANHKNKKINSTTLTKQLIDISERAGIRTRGKSAKDRQDVMVDHGFRKFFTTTCTNIKVDSITVEILLGHDIGLKGVYHRPTEQDLFAEYEKAIDSLTINDENRLKRKVETLETDKSKLEELKQKEVNNELEINSLKSDLKQIASLFYNHFKAGEAWGYHSELDESNEQVLDAIEADVIKNIEVEDIGFNDYELQLLKGFGKIGQKMDKEGLRKLYKEKYKYKEEERRLWKEAINKKHNEE